MISGQKSYVWSSIRSLDVIVGQDPPGQDPESRPQYKDYKQQSLALVSWYRYNRVYHIRGLPERRNAPGVWGTAAGMRMANSTFITTTWQACDTTFTRVSCGRAIVPLFIQPHLELTFTFSHNSYQPSAFGYTYSLFILTARSCSAAGSIAGPRSAQRDEKTRSAGVRLQPSTAPSRSDTTFRAWW